MEILPNQKSGLDRKKEKCTQPSDFLWQQQVLAQCTFTAICIHLNKLPHVSSHIKVQSTFNPFLEGINKAVQPMHNFIGMLVVILFHMSQNNCMQAYYPFPLFWCVQTLNISFVVNSYLHWLISAQISIPVWQNFQRVHFWRLACIYMCVSVAGHISKSCSPIFIIKLWGYCQVQ